MKNKKLFFLGFLTLFIFAIFFFFSKPQSSKKIISYQLQNKTYRLYTAENSAEWGQGLMNYKKLDGVDGMIFVFPNKQYRSFWNKNTLMNLDIYWLDDDVVVGKSYLPAIKEGESETIVNSPKPANKVIELEIKK
ncbi:MAG: DUF192 domain-containing protein [bacterium]|nr:DUF192 domain-containing protein [bacterium]